MLYLIVFLSGAVLMSLEMIGSRLLAPFFGNSIYVWGSLITVVMAALTLGYYLGGKAADRRPSIIPLGAILFLAGLLVGFLPLWSTRLGWRLGSLEPRLGSLLAALAYFFLPSLLMAMVSPFGIKLASRSLGNIGGTAGRMAAISSGGSILGTLVTSFFLVPVMGVRGIVFTQGLMLFGLAALAGLAGLRSGKADKAEGEKSQSLFPLGLIVLACAAALALAMAWRLTMAENPAHPGSSAVTTLDNRDTLYHHLVVDQYINERHLHFDNSWQSAVDLADPERMIFGYTSAMHLAAVARPAPRRALLIGLGGGSIARRYLRDYPTIERLDAVEIDPEVAAVAAGYFLLPDDPRLRVIVEDGRLFVERQARLIAQGRAEPYDIVMIDAFFSDNIPYHLTTLEFLRSLRRTLAPDGVAAANIIGAMGGGRGSLLRAMTKTFGTAFPQVYLFPLGGWLSGDDAIPRNVILVAGNSGERWTKGEWLARAQNLEQQGLLKEPLEPFIESLREEDQYWRAGYLPDAILLTDDYAPVDTLQSPLL